MNAIADDVQFKQAVTSLDASEARIIGAKFVQNVVALADDQRLRRVVEVASTRDATGEEVAATLKLAKTIMLDSYTRCGADGDWNDQAGYFVARAAVACMTPFEKGKPGGPAWQAAMSSRLARTSASIDSDDESASESARQYEILTDYLNSRERETS